MLALIYALVGATFPDEDIYLATNWLHRISPANTLDLPGEDLIDDAKLAHIIEKNESDKREVASGEYRWQATLILKDRDLTEADFSYADLRHVNFSGAILNRANFDSAWVTRAHFDNAQLRNASFAQTKLDGAKLDGAHLRGAILEGAQLRNASLEDAELQEANFGEAQLQGAKLNGAHLQGASLSYKPASVFLAHLLSVREHLESDESFVIQGRRPDSRRGRRCGRTRIMRAMTARAYAIRAM